MAVSVLAAILLACWYYMIFSFSSQDAEQSGSISYEISENCVKFVNSIAGKNWTDTVVNSLAELFEHPLRKLAHFSEYACMGILVYTMLRPWKPRGRKLYLLIILWVFLSAAGDEFHQTFVPGRDGNLPDVLLDTCGGTFGVALSILFEKILRRSKKLKFHLM